MNIIERLLNSKIFNFVIRTLGAIFLLLLSFLVIIVIICAITNYDVLTIIVNVFSFAVAILIAVFIFTCIGEFLEWVFDKIDK